MGNGSDERSECFHQDIPQIEKWYTGNWISNRLVDCCWSFVRETPTGENTRQRRRSKIFVTFSRYDNVYRDIVHYLILCIAIRNQYITY
jgi:hypothetical protein